MNKKAKFNITHILDHLIKEYKNNKVFLAKSMNKKFHLKEIINYHLISTTFMSKNKEFKFIQRIIKKNIYRKPIQKPISSISYKRLKRRFNKQMININVWTLEHSYFKMLYFCHNHLKKKIHMKMNKLIKLRLTLVRWKN